MTYLLYNESMLVILFNIIRDVAVGYPIIDAVSNVHQSISIKLDEHNSNWTKKRNPIGDCACM